MDFILRKKARIESYLTWYRTYLPVIQRPHYMPAPLVVSLTSYLPRFPALYKTLVRLLHQTVKADRVILWISATEMSVIPLRVLALQAKGLEIRPTFDTGPYKKIIPALQEFPDAFIVTADDDLDYDRYWLRDLLQGWDGKNNQIVFHRGHEIPMIQPGRPRPYSEWIFSIKGPRETGELFPTGAGGVLYPPHVLHGDVQRQEDFLRLCPGADDIWLFWMGRRAGAVYKRTARKREIVEADGTQDVALWHKNLSDGANDAYISRMIEKYGWPDGFNKNVTP